jgi:hypothetical protein
MALAAAPAQAAEAGNAGTTTTGTTWITPTGACDVLFRSHGYECSSAYGNEDDCNDARKNEHPDDSVGECNEDIYKQGGSWYYGYEKSSGRPGSPQ